MILSILPASINPRNSSEKRNQVILSITALSLSLCVCVCPFFFLSFTDTFATRSSRGFHITDDLIPPLLLPPSLPLDLLPEKPRQVRQDMITSKIVTMPPMMASRQPPMAPTMAIRQPPMAPKMPSMQDKTPPIVAVVLAICFSFRKNFNISCFGFCERR